MPTVNDPSGTPALVNDEGKLHVYSVMEQMQFHANVHEKECYTVMVDVTTGTADDDFFYLKNKDELDLVITKIGGWSVLNQEVSLYIGGTDAGTDAGDALVPANLNAGSGNTADVDCTQDATDLAISGGRVVRLMKFPPTALQLAAFKFDTGIIVPKNQRLHLRAASAGLINMSITFYFHS